MEVETIRVKPITESLGQVAWSNPKHGSVLLLLSLSLSKSGV